MFKFVIGQVVTWKLVPGSRVIIHERVTRELPGDTIVRAYCGNIAIPHTNGLVPSPELIELAEVLPKEPAV